MKKIILILNISLWVSCTTQNCDRVVLVKSEKIELNKTFSNTSFEPKFKIKSLLDISQLKLGKVYSEDELLSETLGEIIIDGCFPLPSETLKPRKMFEHKDLIDH